MARGRTSPFAKGAGGKFVTLAMEAKGMEEAAAKIRKVENATNKLKNKTKEASAATDANTNSTDKNTTSKDKNTVADKNNIIIYGESLGTGIATEVAQGNNFAGVILESPFTSMIAAAKSKYPIFPIKLLLKDKYESDKKIKNIKSPILIMHGEVDKIVPFWMGKKLYELANQPKYSYFPKYDDHMMEFNKDLINSINLFIKSLN